MRTNKKNDKKHSDLEQKNNEKIINRIIIVLAILAVIVYLISMALNTSIAGYDRWIGRPPGWK